MTLIWWGQKKGELEMIEGKAIKIIGSGTYLPNEVSSEEIEIKFNLKRNFSEKYSGVKSRHQVTFESNGYMGARAIENALLNANLNLNDIDLIISAAATFDYPLPNQSSVILSELKNQNANNIATLDIDTTCLSFVSAFEVASKMLDGNQYKRILIVSSEIASKGLNPSMPESLTLFGDGAAAFILTYDEQSSSRFYKSSFKTFPEGLNYTIIKGGGNKYHFRDYPYNVKLHSFDMEGIKLLKLAKQKLPNFINEFLSDLQIEMKDIDVIVPHQASKAGLTILKNSYAFGENQVVENLETHGNCIAASIPILLHDSINNGKIKRNNTCLLVGTSAGFSIGTVLIKY
jgi:3-oxoacyl-[acyl-carrier-protein] synthase III